MLIVTAAALASVELGLKILIAAASGFYLCQSTSAVTAGPCFSLSSKDPGNKERREFTLPSLVFPFYHGHFLTLPLSIIVVDT